MKTHFETVNLRKTLEEIGKKNAYPNGATPLDPLLRKRGAVGRISKQCMNGTYKFTPYALKLTLKGRGKLPREISVPSLQDKAILKALNNALRDSCPINNQTQLAFFVISKVSEELKKLPKNAKVLRLDIKKFFDTIDHDKLFHRLDEKDCPVWMQNLIENAITTPAKEHHEKTPDKRELGVPQGLAIASHLSDLYLESFDALVKKYCQSYYRYVDDMLIFFEPSQEKDLLEFIYDYISKMELEIHKEGKSDKFFNGKVRSKKGFDYLGYHFWYNDSEFVVSVRDSSVQKFLNTLIGMITKYQKGGYWKAWPDREIAERAFIFEMNEKITGAFRDDKRYGWLWYFRQTNDLALLERMDKIIRREMKKEPETENIRLKRLKRTHYEIQHFTDEKTFILNYGDKNTVRIKRLYGDFDKGIKRASSPAAIIQAFELFANRRVKGLMLDEVRAS